MPDPDDGNKENLYGNMQEMLNAKPWLPFRKGIEQAFPINIRRLDPFISCYLVSLTRFDPLLHQSNSS